jgi:hypothetical protein
LLVGAKVAVNREKYREIYECQLVAIFIKPQLADVFGIFLTRFRY